MSSSTPKSIEKMTVNDLKSELKKRALPINGLKEELKKRLQEAMASDQELKVSSKEEENQTETKEDKKKPDSSTTTKNEQKQEDNLPSSQNDKMEEDKPSKEKNSEDKKRKQNEETKKDQESSKKSKISEPPQPSVSKDKNAVLPDEPVKDSSTTSKSESSTKTLKAKNESKSSTKLEPEKREVPPPKNSPTNALFIKNLVRPFLLSSLKELLSETGTIEDWGLDSIKSKCYVVYKSKEEAEATRQALYGLVWPTTGKSKLDVEFYSADEAKILVLGENAEKPEKKATKTLDELFKKTTSQPPIYYLPLTEKEVEAKSKKTQEPKNNNNERSTDKRDK